MLPAASLKILYCLSLSMSATRGSSSVSSSFSIGGSNIFDLISANVAAITRYSAANSKFSDSIKSIYSIYWSVIFAISRSKISIFCFLIKYQSKSSGPVKVSRQISNALGGIKRSLGNSEGVI